MTLEKLNYQQSKKAREFDQKFLKVLDSIWGELKRLQNQRDSDVNKMSYNSPTETFENPNFIGSTTFENEYKKFQDLYPFGKEETHE